MSLLCQIRHVLDQLIGPVGLVAAVLWFVAAWQAGRSGFLSTPIAQFDRGMKTQAWLNAAAAFFTGVAALAQVVVTSYLPVCRDFG